ncbi:MAG TPA: AbrB/MazE/SpoVT family DNA-binding domain-containing protein [Thermomicrobiales bacterium]|nr:AbrB/MazE/SpoVT family DNA-binding domain-containing protein [Thermomicrobiales bacterium]
MIQQQLRKSGNSLVVTIPKEEVDRLGLREGQFVAVQLTPMELKPVLAPDLQEALDRLWPRLEPALRYLKDR